MCVCVCVYARASSTNINHDGRRRAGAVVGRMAAPVGVDEAAAALAGVDQAFDLWRARRGGTSLRVFRNDGGDLMTSH